MKGFLARRNDREALRGARDGRVDGGVRDDETALCTQGWVAKGRVAR